MVEARQGEAVGGLEQLGPEDHLRLVRLCARLTGDPIAAEDLAQETLLEAWRHRRKLIAPEGYAAWLAAIARNVCLRWWRRQGRNMSHQVAAAEGAGLLERQPAGFDLEIELERHELAELLDRAMALLPPATRTILVARYLHEAPQRELAARLGLTEGAVEARLHRGRLALRQILATNLRADAAAYGLARDHDAAWQATRIWCPFCGAHRLDCRLDRPTGEAHFHCPGCAGPTGGQIAHTYLPRIIDGVSSFKAVLARQIRWLDDYYRGGLAAGRLPCPFCRRWSLVEPRLPVDVPAELQDAPGMHITCPACGVTDKNPLHYLVLDLPATQRFWRAHPRMRVVPDLAIEFAGRPALLTTFESCTSHDRLDVISAADTLAVLEVHTTSTV